MFNQLKYSLCISLLSGLLTAGQALALTPTPTPRPPTPTPTRTATPNPQPANFRIRATCSLTYVHDDVPRATTVSRNCGLLAQVKVRGGARYSFPTSCTLNPGQRSCMTTVDFRQARQPLPPTAVIEEVKVFSEKLNRPGLLEEIRGCTYDGGEVQANAVYDAGNTLVGIDATHLLFCKNLPQ